MKENVISMTELQKLSLKKLRKMKLPLYVLDRKSKGGGFVIVGLGGVPTGKTSEKSSKIVPDPNLFWNLKEGVTFDPDNPSDLDMYMQQVLARGNSQDVRTLIKTIDRARFQKGFERIKNFLAPEVRSFWEGYFGDR
jgi:hypothetical protein